MKRFAVVVGIAVFLVNSAACQSAKNGGGFEAWSKTVSAQNNSPAAAEPGDYQQHWESPDGRKIQLTVKVPRPLASAPTITLAAVPDGADARPYFDDALEQVRSKKAARLVVPKGTYVFKSLGRGNAGQWVIAGLSDVVIDGSGSTLVFNLNKPGISLNTSRRVALENFTIEYGLKMAALGTVVAQGGENVLKVDPAYPVTAEDTMGHMSEYDTAAKRLVPNGTKFYWPPGDKLTPKFVGDQTYESTALQGKNVLGKTFLIFQQWYGGTAIELRDNVGPQASEDIILNGITIASGPGMGIVAYGLKRGLGIWNSKIEAKPGALVSTEYDAIHTLLTGGDVAIHDNEIANQGDDGINLNNPVTPVYSIEADGKSMVLSTFSRFIVAHDRLDAFDDSNKYLGSAEVMDTPKPLGGPNNQWNGITLSNPIPGLTTKSFFRDERLTESRVAVTHNIIRDCGCHGVLVQVPNTLVADNLFSNTSANAIRVLTSMGYFKEGVGAINVAVRNNTIRNPGMDIGIHGMHWAAIGVYGGGASGVTSEPSNKYLDISGNTIVNALQSCISVASSEFVTITGNTCTNTNLAPAFHRLASIFVYDSSHVTVKDNHRSDTPLMGGIDVDPATTKDVDIQKTY